MSDNILPFEIQIEIIKRVSDVKSLLRFRAVSKPWKSLIESSEFISGYGARKTQPHTLFLRYLDKSNEAKYVAVNNDTLTQQQDLAPNVSALMKPLRNLVVIGCSRGLCCLYNIEIQGILVLWNPSIRRCVGITILNPTCLDFFSFKVCPVTNEPTILKISMPLWKVEVFTLSSKKWTEIQCSKPRESVKLFPSKVVIGGCVYRAAYEENRLPYHHFKYRIVSFDLFAKEFRTIDLPDKLINTFTSPGRFILSKLKGSLVVMGNGKVWKMEPDCSFTQLFAINNMVGFRKNGDLLFENNHLYSALKVYDSCSKQITNLGVSGQDGTFFVNSYKETLLLLDHSDSSVYPEMN